MVGTRRTGKWIVIGIIVAGRLQATDEKLENPVGEAGACF
jgi:hypothetical protein